MTTEPEERSDEAAARRDAAELADALDVVRAAGYVAIKEKSYRAAQERQRLAQCGEAYERSRREGAEQWARDCCDQERRIRERLTFVYGVARAHGATVEDLRGEICVVGGGTR